MQGSKSTHLKHLPNALLTSASQNYISGDHAVNKALTQAARSIKAAQLARLMDARAVGRLHLTAAVRVWKSAADVRLLGRVEEVLVKLRPFEGTRGKLQEGNSEDSIIVAAFSPASRLESELEMRQLDLKLANLTRLLEAWKGKLSHHSVSTQTMWEPLQESRDLLKDSLQLQDTEPRLEDRKLESLLSIDESYDLEHTPNAKSGTFADITETEFIGNLPDKDPSLLIMRLKALEKQLIDRENRLIQLTKTTHHELELLIQERDQISKEREIYSNLEDIRSKLARETLKLESRSRALDAVTRKQRELVEAASLQTSVKEEATDHFRRVKKNAVLNWLRTNLRVKGHNQRGTKTLAFNVWKAVSRLESCQIEEIKGPATELNWLEMEENERKQADFMQGNFPFSTTNECENKSIPTILLRAVFLTLSKHHLKRLRTYWIKYRQNALNTATNRPKIPCSIPAVQISNCLFTLCERRLQLSHAFASLKNFSSTYENKLLRSHLSLFDVSLQHLQRQEAAFQAQVLIVQSQTRAKLARLASLFSQYL